MSDDVPADTGRRPHEPSPPVTGHEHGAATGPGHRPADAPPPVTSPEAVPPPEPDVLELEHLVRRMAVLTRAPRTPDDVLACLVLAWPDRLEVADAALAVVEPSGQVVLAAQRGAIAPASLDDDQPLRRSLAADRPIVVTSDVARRFPGCSARALVAARVVDGDRVTGAFVLTFERELDESDAAQAGRLARVAAGLVALAR